MIGRRGTTVLLAITASAGAGAVAAPVHGADQPPPPLPTKLTPTPGTALAALQPVISSTHILRHSGRRLTATRTLNHGDRARFVVAWSVNQRTSLGATGELEIMKDQQVLYGHTMRGRSGAVGGVLHADVRLTSPLAVGNLVPRFTVQLGSSTKRSLSFTVAASPARYR